MNAYSRWLNARLRQCRREYAPSPQEGLFSLITPVFDTPPGFLRALAWSVFGQDYPCYEWIVVDNGSTSRATRRCLDWLAKDSRVRLTRIEPNRGILGGTRVAAKQATGRYLLPVDSDDLLYPHALRVLAAVLEQHDWPAIAYSDEDKLLSNGEPCHPFLKPDWDPVLFWNICYVAHLCAIDRAEALRLGAYLDPSANGCHDWDTFLQFVRTGHEPVHVPEVLYSWRMHAGSTSTPDSSPKSYTLGCQHAVLTQHLQSLGLDDRLEVRTNPLFGGVGLWQAARRHVHAAALHVLCIAQNDTRWRLVLRALAECSYPRLSVRLVTPGDLTRKAAGDWARLPVSSGMTLDVLAGQGLQSGAVRGLLASLPPHELVAVIHDDVVPLSLDWPWEAQGFFELQPDTAVVGGRVLNRAGCVVRAAEIFGVDGLVGSPDRGRAGGDKGLYGLHICQRSTDAVSGEFFIARAGFLRDVLAEDVDLSTPQLLSAWLGGRARQRGHRVVYSPHVASRLVDDEVPREVTGLDRRRFTQEFGPLALDDRHYSRHYARTWERAYYIEKETSGGLQPASGGGRPVQPRRSTTTSPA